MTVADTHIARVVHIDAVAIAYLYVVQQRDAIYHGILTTNEVNRPIGSFANGHIPDHQPFHAYQRQHMRTGVKRRVLQGFQFITV